jgi:hypothetical protein
MWLISDRTIMRHREFSRFIMVGIDHLVGVPGNMVSTTVLQFEDTLYSILAGASFPSMMWMPSQVPARAFTVFSAALPS